MLLSSDCVAAHAGSPISSGTLRSASFLGDELRTGVLLSAELDVCSVNSGAEAGAARIGLLTSSECTLVNCLPSFGATIGEVMNEYDDSDECLASTDGRLTTSGVTSGA